MIETLLNELGIQYSVIGEEAVSTCPFHSPDRHPSWSINTRSGLHHCFSCGAAGNLAHLVSFLKGMTYAEAVIYVNSIVGWARADKWREDYENKNISPQSFKINEADLALFTDIPQEYLDGRGIERRYADLYGARWNKEERSWVLPIRDPYSYELWGWQEKLTNVRQFRNYPRGIKKSKTLFGIHLTANGSRLILVESGLDAMRVCTFGEGIGVACGGLPVSDYQLSLIFERTESLVLCLDNDSHGISETTRICREYGGSIKDVRVVDYGSSKKDPGEMTDVEVDRMFKYKRSSLNWLRKCGV